jgi:hypothetical protein
MHMAHRKTIGLFLAAILLSTLSCMKDQPEELPDELVWNPDLAFPLGIDTFAMNAESGFDTTLFELDPATDLPLWVGELEVVMEGQEAFSLDMLGASLDEIRRIMFRVNLYNGFPHEVAVQAYFGQWNGTLLDSLFKDGPVLVGPARPLGSGEETKESFTRKDASFNREELQALDASEVIYLRALISTTEVDTALVDFYRDYLLVVDVGLKGQMSYTF